MDEKIMINFEYKDGTTDNCELLTLFTAENGKEYMALLNSNNAIQLVRATQDGEQYALGEIEDEEELRMAQEAFEKLTDVAEKSERPHGEDERGVENFEKIILTDENGNEKEYYVIDVFEARNRNYIALAPKDDVSEYNIDVVLMRFEYTTENGVEGISVTPITSDMEFNDVHKAFSERVGGEDETLHS